MLKKIHRIRTSIHNERFKELEPIEFSGKDLNINAIVIDSKQVFQTHLGFGGAFTESAAHALSKVSLKNRQEAINAYFSDDGLKYNLGRTHINSCDFSLGNYYYIPKNAKDLNNFDIAREDKLTIPLISDAQKAARKKLQLLASPWSPPPHFKDTNEMNFGGELKKEYMPLWAEYYCRYILEMRKRDIDVNFISVQNEPLAVQTWDSCFYSAEKERDFVRDYLIPALTKFGLNEVKIIIWDHNRDVMVERAGVIYQDSICREKVWGTGIHWYIKGFHENLAVHKALFPEKHILFTEGCVEYKPLSNEVKAEHGSWSSAERYAENIINDFNNHCEGFIDWNLFLDSFGGPNHVNNFCEAPIMVDEKNDKLIYNPSYFYIGHFSKFIEAGAKRIYNVHNCGNDVLAASYINPDGGIIAVVLNKGWIKCVSLNIEGKAVNISLPDHSITTFIIKQN